MGHVFYLELPRQQKLVLLALADHADDDGTGCYPTLRRLAVKVSVQERQVRREVAGLEASGYLVRIVNASPDERLRVDRRPNEYQLDAQRIYDEGRARREDLFPPADGRSPTTARAADGRSPTTGTGGHPRPPNHQKNHQ